MGFVSSVYNSIFKRTSTLTAAVIMSAFFFERSFDVVTERIFEKYNEGKLWKHIKHNYE